MITARNSAMFCWAIKTLNPQMNYVNAKNTFSYLAHCYDHPARYYHRGLGHPTALFPAPVKALEQMIEMKDEQDEVNLIETIDVHAKRLFSQNELVAQAKNILSAFYHDVVHRKGIKPSILNSYTTTDEKGARITKPESLPLTANIIDNPQSNLRPEELSCIVAEDALRGLQIQDKDIIPILLSIIATIPFNAYSQPDNLRQRLMKVLHATKIEMTPLEIDATIDQAISLSNKDLGSYGEDTLYEFDKKTWAMMYERSTSLAEPQHEMREEAAAILKIYLKHKNLLNRTQTQGLKIYESRDEKDTAIQQLNENAIELLKKDILLKGIQLGSLAVLTAILHPDQQPAISTAAAVKHKSVRQVLSRIVRDEKCCAEVTPDISATLSKYARLCRVNDIEVMHGSLNGHIALQLARSLGVSTLMKFADQFAEIVQGQVAVTDKRFISLVEQINLALLAAQKKHVIIYTDLNGTIMAGDKANGKSVEDSICQMLCEDSKLKSIWCDEVQTPMTFREFIETHLCKGDHRDQALKQVRKQWYKKFPHYLHETKHDLADEVSTRLEGLKEKLSKGVVFESFINLIKHFMSNDISFTIVLNTFGEDLEEAAQDIQRRTGLEVDFLGKFHENKLHYAKFHDNENKKKRELIAEEGHSFDSAYDVYNVLKQFKLCAVQSDWRYWHANGERADYGKRFIFDKHNPNIVSCFYDDNLMIQIIKAEPLGDMEVFDQGILQARLVEKGMIVDVVTSDAVEQDLFYIQTLDNLTARSATNVSASAVSSLFKTVMMNQSNFSAQHDDKELMSENSRTTKLITS